MPLYRRFVMVGPFPPPVHGMAESNAAVLEMLRSAGGEPEVLNVAHTDLDRTLAGRLGRLPKVLARLIRLAMLPKSPGDAFYISISGGFGQAYDAAFLGIARLRRMRLYLHHRSFAYLDRPSRLALILTMVAGRAATHVALCPRMAGRLRDVYRVENVLVASNALIVSTLSTSVCMPRAKLSTIGFFSNLAFEKGVLEFLDLMEQLEADRINVVAKLAGPFQDAKVENAVRNRLEKLQSIEYVGSKYGLEKEEFLSSIDALIFPTLYANEAEPRTIHEAISHGIPVIAYGRGCIPELLDKRCGLVIDPHDPFVPSAVAQIVGWIHDSSGFEAASRAARQRFETLCSENKTDWDCLIGDILLLRQDS